MKIVVDASIATKLVVIEGDHLALMKLVEDRHNVLLAPELVLAEVGNVLWKKNRRGEITPLQVQHALADILDVFDELVPLEGLAGPALDFALKLDHPIYDCFYLACAQKMQAQILTADRRFRAAAESAGASGMFLDLSSGQP